MTPVLSAAEIARMTADIARVIDTLGVRCSVTRLVRDADGQTTPAGAPHLTDVAVRITPLTGVAEFIEGTPAGELYEGRTTVYTTAQLQETDILTTADGTTYQVQVLRPFLTHLILVLSTWRDASNTTS